MNGSRTVWKLWTSLIVMLALTCLAGAKEVEYAFAPDSLPQEGVPKGAVTKHTLNDSHIYPGTTHGYWVYLPAQYDASKPACVMVFLDGADFILLKGEVRVPTVFDNLIHTGEIPVTIGIFINPGRKGSDVSMRGEQYLPLNDTWAKSGGTGCQEPMSDKKNYTNYTRIIENTEARVVMQWRYPLQDVDHVYANYDENTGWYDVADWYCHIYPDGVATKLMQLWTHGDRDHEWQESEVIHAPNQRPEDNIKTEGTLTMANIKGESYEYSYADGPPRSTDKPVEK
jgi:hypothetical protein